MATPGDTVGGLVLASEVPLLRRGRTHTVKLQRRTDLHWERLGASVALLDTCRGMVHGLDGAAAAVWLSFESASERDAVAREVASQGYEVRAVADAIDSMLELELLMQVDGLGRRTLLRRGLTATAAGAVLSIALPDVAAAASAGNSLYSNTAGYSLTGTTGGPGTVVDGNPQPKIDLLTANFPQSQPGLNIFLSILEPAAATPIIVSWTGTTSLSIDLAAEISANFDPSIWEDPVDIASATADRDAWVAATWLRADFGDQSETSLQWYGKAFGPTAS